MELFTYEEFVQWVEKYKILPFSEFVPEHPSLTSAAAQNQWHTNDENDPWLWRIQIAHDGAAAYGKFFGPKAAFIHTDFFALVRTALSSNKTVDERYKDGLISNAANRLYKVLSENGNIDSRNLRKEAGLNAKEDKKDYEKALVELQNYGDVVITGAAKQSDHEAGWSSMCYQPSELWLQSIQRNSDATSVEQAKELLKEQLSLTCSAKALTYFVKKLHLK
ncbi:hypothetical protein M3223_00740 [Paenibacillus pasadenensis]|uniref:AlkZ-related protein n=1 Tax=Paenibacillus pasadenensis TaxID=217090 RepID=UPI002041A03F|nr:hypothetical protein [Paenibacillus pasadenensis]MCM3745870.1 hypothetical protein [Paenibacillus pasadenensis]